MALGAALLLTHGAAAQSAYLVSTTLDVTSPFTADDSDLIRVEENVAPRVQFGVGHWAATIGALPGDVDALAFWRSQGAARHEAFAFSLLSNELGFLDGDVLGFAPGGGLQVLVPEATLADALGLFGVNIDVDALAYDDQDRLLFSLQSDQDGSPLGPLQNGDVYRLEANGTASILVTEDDVQAAFLFATGTTDPVGDVHGIEWADGELIVATQGPNAVDGGAFSVGALPALVLDEDFTGLGGSEIDALVRLEGAEDHARLLLAPAQLVAGGPVQASYEGGSPNAPVLVLWAGSSGYLLDALPGFGAWYLDPLDPYLGAALSAGAVLVLVTDGSGSATFDFDAPLGDVGGLGFTGQSGWTFQALDLVGLELSAPFRAEF